MSLLDFSGSGTFTEVLLCYMQEELLNPHMESSPRRCWLTGSNTCWGPPIRSPRSNKKGKKRTERKSRENEILIPHLISQEQTANQRGRQTVIIWSSGLHHFLCTSSSPPRYLCSEHISLPQIVLLCCHDERKSEQQKRYQLYKKKGKKDRINKMNVPPKKMSDIFCREEKNSNLKQRAQTVSFGTFFCRIPAHETTLIGQRKSGVPGNHRPIGLKSINGPVGCCWAHSVICDYKGQSDVAGDGECRFTPVENYTSAGLKGLTHLHARAHTHTLMYHSEPSIQAHAHTYPVQTPTCTHTYSPKPVGNFIEHKEQ